MADPVPTIPLWLAHRPTVGGVVVPWITPRAADGRYLLGVIDRDLAEQALRRRRCGVCGRDVGDRLVLMMRLSDLARQRTTEPALDPTCAHYTTRACPMIGGRLGAYRTSPVRLDENMIRSADTDARQGARAEPWFAVWLVDYHLVEDHGHLAASYAGTGPLRIRPLTWRFPAI